MLDFHSVADQLSAYIPYAHNAYFVVFLAASLVYVAVKLAAPRRRSPGAQPAFIRAPRAERAVVAAPRVPFLRSAIAFITYVARIS